MRQSLLSMTPQALSGIARLTASMRQHIMGAVLAVAVLMAAPTVHASLTITGDYSPATDPSTWTTATAVFIGNTTGAGSLVLNGGSTLSLRAGTLGNGVGTTGTASVDGAGSTWSNTNNFFVGSDGTGTLSITDGGGVSDNAGYLGRFAGATGTAVVSGTNSRWTNTTLNVGFSGTGSLTITNGGRASDSNGHIGFSAGSSGTATVEGTGSRWTNPASLNVGNSGAGRLFVTDGGSVTSGSGNIGLNAGSTGAATVNGAGSNWVSNSTINVGSSGTGKLSIGDGGFVSAVAVSINAVSNLTADLGKGSSLTIGTEANNWTGTITNNGTIRLAAGAGAASGSYTPISYGTLTGSGTVQALGGVWDATNKTVTVSNAATGQAGVATTIDRSVTQRILITDGATGKQVGASFQAAIAPANLSLTASLMNNSQLSLLQGLLDPGKAILSGWDFSATGYTAGDPVYLSLEVGSGQRFLDLDLWHFDGTSWAKYLNTDLAYDNNFASFVATGFSGYAISGLAPVPVPAAVWLFGSGLAAMVGLARRKSGE